MTKRKIAITGLQAALSASLAVAALSAVAQDIERLALEEIVVTARKTAENAQDVPLTVNVVTAQRLENAGVRSVAEVRNLVSNVYWHDYGGGTTDSDITMRGIRSNAALTGFDPGIGIYMDGVYVGNVAGFNTALLDVERIEVLKGPQGTLFGRNTTAGAIAVHTRRPSTSENYTEVSGQFGSYDLKEGRAVANWALTETAALKVSGIYRDREGYQTNVVTGRRDLNDENFYGARAQLLLTPTPDLDLLFTGDWFRNDDLQNVPSCFGGTACGFNPNFDSIFDDRAADNHSYTKRTLWSGSLNAVWRAPGGYEWTSITAYQDRQYQQDQDQDYVGLDLIRSGYDQPDNSEFSQELRIATPRESRLRSVAGLYYSYEDRTISIPTFASGSLVTALLGIPAADIVMSTDAKIKTRSAAVFGQSSYDITPRLVAELGLRYTDDSKDFFYEQTMDPSALALPAPVRQALNVLATDPLSASDSWGKATGLASLTWRATDSVNTYVRYSQGYKSGGFQSTTAAAGPIVGGEVTSLTRPDIPFRPEELDAWEIGAKMQFFGNRLRVNLAAFTMDYQDIQIQITSPINFTKLVTNGGGAESEGIELEASLVPFRGFTIDAGIGIQQAEYVEDAFIGGVAVTSLEGMELPYAPETTANLTASYNFDIAGGWQMLAAATASYRSAMWLDSQNQLESPSVTLLNARIGIEPSDAWGIYLWGHNLTDERRITGDRGVKVGLSEGNFYLSTPRTYGVEVKARF